MLTNEEERGEKVLECIYVDCVFSVCILWLEENIVSYNDSALQLHKSEVKDFGSILRK